MIGHLEGVNIVVCDEYTDLADAVYRAECATVDVLWQRGEWCPLYTQGAYGDAFLNGGGVGNAGFGAGHGDGGDEYGSLDDGSPSWSFDGWDWNDPTPGYDVELDTMVQACTPFTMADIRRMHAQLGHASIPNAFREWERQPTEYEVLARVVWDAEYALIEVPWQRPGWRVLCGPEFVEDEVLPVGLDGGAGHGDGLYGELVVDAGDGTGDYGECGGLHRGGYGGGDFGLHYHEGDGRSASGAMEDLVAV